MKTLDIVVLAAGKGTRMKSRMPKVLQQLGGRALIGHVLTRVATLKPRRVCVVVGHGADAVEAFCRDWVGVIGGLDLYFARQEPQLGTGHAVQQALPSLAGNDGAVLVLSGDVPLTGTDTLQALAAAAGAREVLTLLTVELPDPHGYGRVVRTPAGLVARIVEERDATADERAIHEIYSGILVAPAARLHDWLARLSNDNAQGEYYLTDIVAMAVADGVDVVAQRIADPAQLAGVNSPAQLAALEREYQMRNAAALMEEGVRLADPARFDLRDDPATGICAQLVCGRDVEIDVGCIFSGRVELGDGVHVGPYCSIANARIAAGAEVRAYSHVDGARAGVRVGAGARVGPFSRLRPGADLGIDAHVGNFVEIKNSTLADGAKANHLAYLGDASIGERVNIGAGTITANYDGVHKFRTVVGAGARVGSNSVLVAPVTVGDNATIGAGSVISRDAPAGTLTLGRGRQVTIAGWQRPEADVGDSGAQ